MRIVEMTIDHYAAVMALMRETPGVTVRNADSREATQRYLQKAKSLFEFRCRVEGNDYWLRHVWTRWAERIPAACDCRSRFRGRGIAHQLVTRCLDGLEALGIRKTHIDVFWTNGVANTYWTRRGWKRRDDIYRYSYNRSNNENA